MAWYHPEGVAPLWEIPEVPEFSDPEHFTEMVTRDYIVHAPWQELAENGVDSAHFRYVHHTEEVPELQSLRPGPERGALLRDHRHGAHGLQHADRRFDLPHALQLHRAQAG